MAKGHRVWHVERTEGRWKPMDEYTVATNTMMAGGGHNYRTLTKGEKRAEHGSQYETIRRWFAKKLAGRHAARRPHREGRRPETLNDA